MIKGLPGANIGELNVNWRFRSEHDEHLLATTLPLSLFFAEYVMLLMRKSGGRA